jgi:hypothetical protein
VSGSWLLLEASATTAVVLTKRRPASSASQAT